MNKVFGSRGEKCYIEDNLLKVIFPNEVETEFAIDDDVRNRIFGRQVVIQSDKSIGFIYTGAVTIMMGENRAVFNEAEFLSLF